MGGSVFTSGDKPLFTPRMPPDVYILVRDHCHAILRQYYENVASPIEAPKEDHGDVDILVACPRELLSKHKDIVEILGAALGAEQSKRGGSIFNFALPWPETQFHNTDGPKAQRFIQIDVHSCDSKLGWTWELFHLAHGDLWNMIGSTIRPYGITINDTGLYLRIEQIEAANRKKSMVFLTNNPTKVLDFLGLDVGVWETQFNKVESIFEYAAQCRLFSINTKSIWEHDSDKEPELKANDRKRMSKRPIFRAWIDDFIPKCRQQGRYNRDTPSRQQLLEEIFISFGVREEYLARLKNFQLEKQVDEVWRKAIKGGVPFENVDPQQRAASIRLLKSFILDNNKSSEFDIPATFKKEDEFYDEDLVTKFVADNWEKAGRIGVAMERARAAEQMESKRLKKST